MRIESNHPIISQINEQVPLSGGSLQQVQTLI